MFEVVKIEGVPIKTQRRDQWCESDLWILCTIVLIYTK